MREIADLFDSLGDICFPSWNVPQSDVVASCRQRATALQAKYCIVGGSVTGGGAVGRAFVVECFVLLQRVQEADKRVMNAQQWNVRLTIFLYGMKFLLKNHEIVVLFRRRFYLTS